MTWKIGGEIIPGHNAGITVNGLDKGPRPGLEGMAKN